MLAMRKPSSECTVESRARMYKRITREAGMGSKQGRHCTYNVTLQRVRVTIAAVKSNKYYIL